jgi:hypothetical protein
VIDPLEYRGHAAFGRIEWPVYKDSEYISISRSFVRTGLDHVEGRPYIDLKELEVGKRHAQYGVQFEIVEKTEKSLTIKLFSGFNPDLIALRTEIEYGGIEIEID